MRHATSLLTNAVSYPLVIILLLQTEITFQIQTYAYSSDVMII